MNRFDRPLYFPKPIVRPVSMEALAGLREILSGVTVAASKVVPALRVAAAKMELMQARTIEDGSARHRAVKAARDRLRRARKRQAARYR